MVNEPLASLTRGSCGVINRTMRSIYRSRYTTWQRACAAALALALPVVGVLLTQHHHESEVGAKARGCRHAHLTAATSFEKLEPEHHEPCGLCTKTLCSTRLERPHLAFVDEIVDEPVSEVSWILPDPPGRHGASRAPPVA